MAVHFILGGSGRGKSYYVNHMISKMAADEPQRQFIILVPEQFTMQTQREIVEISPAKGIMNIDVQSFVRLAYRVFGETGAGSLPVLDDMGKTMILRKVLINREKELSYFGRNVHKKGFVAEIKSFLSELLQYGISQEMLQEMTETVRKRPVLYRKLKDMEVAYAGFTEYLKENYITSEEVLGVLRDVVPESKILRDAVICLDGFTGFTPVQYQLIEQLMLYCKEVYLTVTIGRGEELIRVGPKHRLFYLSRKTMEKFRLLARQNHIDICPEVWTGTTIEESRFADVPGIAYMEQHIFRYPVSPYDKAPEDISIHVLAQPEQEISFVVRQISELCRGGSRYRDIAVVTGDMEVYGILAEEAFEKSGFPCFIDRKKSILIHPFVIMIGALMDIVISDFSYESVMQYFRGRYAPLPGEDIDILDNFLLATGIRGHKKWQETWETEYVFPAKGEQEREEIRERINRVRQMAWQHLEKFYEGVSGGKQSAGDFSQKLEDFLEEHEFCRKLAEDVERFEQEGNLADAKEYGQVYDIVTEVLERLTELLGEETMTFREYRELLDTGFSEARVGLIPPGVDQIVVGDITRTRLAHVDYLFFLGVNDCNIPKGSGGGGVLSAAERSFLEQQEYELAPTDREAVFTEQFYLYLNLTKPQKHLYICFCETGNDGRAQSPAYLVERVQSLFPKLEISVEEQCCDDRHILGDDRGFRYLIQGLRNKNIHDKKWQEIYRYYRMDEGRKKQLEPVLSAAFYREGKTRLSQRAALALYEKVLRGSASQLERYASCAYSYFLRYGLGLSERAEHAVEFFDIGNVVHEALELYTRELLSRGESWQDREEEMQRRQADRCLDEVVARYKNGLLYDTHRDTHLIRRLRRILYRTIWAITQQMKLGQFRTVDSELSFAQLYGPLRLVGRVDRVDEMETEEAAYVTIIDYKTGKKDISLSDMYYGLQMQLVIYLQAASERERKKMVIPAGIFYYNIEDPMLDGSGTDEGREKEILTALRLRGLVNEDDPVLPSVDNHFATDSGELPASTASLVAPFETDKNGALKKKSSAVTTEDFRLLMEYSQSKLRQMSAEILSGNIDINPYKRLDSTGATACDYCPYHGVCRFDVRLEGQSYRGLKGLSDDDALHRMKETVGGEV